VETISGVRIWAWVHCHGNLLEKNWWAFSFQVWLVGGCFSCPWKVNPSLSWSCVGDWSLSFSFCYVGFSFHPELWDAYGISLYSNERNINTTFITSGVVHLGSLGGQDMECWSIRETLSWGLCVDRRRIPVSWLLNDFVLLSLVLLRALLSFCGDDSYM
jgi:hypothetical protein